MADVTLPQAAAPVVAEISQKVIEPSEGIYSMKVMIIGSISTNTKGAISGIRTTDGKFFPIVKSVREAADAKDVIKPNSYALVNASSVRNQRTNQETGKLETVQPYIVNEVTAVFTDMNQLAAAIAKSQAAEEQLTKTVTAMVAHINKAFNPEDAAAKAIAANLI